MVQKYSTFQLWLPPHFICCQTAVKLMQEDYFDKAISKDRIQNKNILVSPINVKYMVFCQTLLVHTSENLFSFKLHYILFSEICLVPV